MTPERSQVRLGASDNHPFSLHLFARSDQGVVAVIFALTLPALIGALAIGIEIGLRQMEQRKLQHAADAAAISGAIGRIEWDYAEGDAEVLASSFHVAAASGFAPSDNRENSLLRPYGTYPDNYELRYQDDDLAVEVVLRTERPGLFSAIWPGDGVLLSARATAGLGGEGDEPCVLGPVDIRDFQLT